MTRDEELFFMKYAKHKSYKKIFLYVKPWPQNVFCEAIVKFKMMNYRLQIIYNIP